MRWIVSTIIALCMLSVAAQAQQTRPATRPVLAGDGKLPYLQFDSAKKQVRMECEAVNADMALEFLVCVAGTSEHETVLRSRARPAHLHLAMIMAGFAAGEPMRFDRAKNKVIPPTGERLKLTCEFVRDGKRVRIPAYRLMRNVKTKAEMPASCWVFAGSATTPDGEYAADIRGHLISVVNFPDSTIDVPEVKSSSNETLEWEVNRELAPPRDAKVWVVIEKAE